MKRLAVVMGIILAVCAVTASRADGQVINGCYQKNNGQLRVLASPGDACRPSEVAIQWDLKGDKGEKGDKGDKGDTGATGTPGETGRSPLLNWSEDRIAIDGAVTGPHLTGPQGPQGPAGTSARASRAELVGFVPLETCTSEDELSCAPRMRVGVALPEHARYAFDLFGTHTSTDGEGEPQTVERVMRIKMYRPPRVGSSCGSSAVDVTVTQTTAGTLDGTFRFCVAADDPVYNVKSDLNVPAAVRNEIELVASYVPDWLVFFDVDGSEAASVKETEPLGQGLIHAAYSLPNSFELNGSIGNIGADEANFVFTVTNVQGVCLDPVPAHTRLLQPGETHAFSIDLQTCDGVVPGHCQTDALAEIPDRADPRRRGCGVRRMAGATDSIGSDPDPRRQSRVLTVRVWRVLPPRWRVLLMTGALRWRKLHRCWREPGNEQDADRRNRNGRTDVRGSSLCGLEPQLGARTDHHLLKSDVKYRFVIDMASLK